MGKDNACIVSIPIWDKCRIHVLSYLFGMWMLFKNFAKWIWDPKGFFRLNLRDNPPQCLLDSSLGQHKYIKLKGVKLHYVESGQKDQPMVLLLHGFPDCWLSWRHQIPVLSQHFRVIALDLKGFGDSDKPLYRKSYRIDVILEELKQFIIAQNNDKSCTIIGHDLGALLGWYFVHIYPGLVDKFFAVSCPHPNIYVKTLSSTFNYQWLNFIQLPYLPEIDALKEDVKIINEYHNHLQSKDVYLEAYKYSFSRKEDWTGPINYYRNLPFNKVSEFSEINVSTILITGNKDKFVNLESVVKSTDYCEKFYMKIIEGAGHFPHQENPEMFNRIMLKYLQKRTISSKYLEKSPSKRLMDGLFDAVSSTVKYGNSVFDSVQKKTNGVVSSIPSIGLPLRYNGSTGSSEQ